MTPPVQTAPVVVIGIGHEWRGDDGVGAVAVDEVTETLGRRGEIDLVVLDGESTRLIDAWRGRELAVVVDAVRSGAEPGAIRRLEVGADVLPEPGASASSHATGLAEAVALAEALDALPARLVILGIEAADATLGAPLSPPVRAALPTLVDRIVREVSP